MIVASTESMNKLTSEQQQIVRECAQEAGQLQRKWMQEYDEKAKVIEELKSDLYNAFGIDE